PDRGGRSLRDRRREDEAAVVVGVLADQVHASGSIRDHLGRAAEDTGERVGDHAQRGVMSAGFQYSRHSWMRPSRMSATLIPHHSIRRPSARVLIAITHSARTTSPATAMFVTSKASGRAVAYERRTSSAKAARPIGSAWDGERKRR